MHYITLHYITLHYITLWVMHYIAIYRYQYIIFDYDSITSRHTSGYHCPTNALHRNAQHFIKKTFFPVKFPCNIELEHCIVYRVRWKGYQSACCMWPCSILFYFRFQSEVKTRVPLEEPLLWHCCISLYFTVFRCTEKYISQILQWRQCSVPAGKGYESEASCDLGTERQPPVCLQ